MDELQVVREEISDHHVLLRETEIDIGDLVVYPKLDFLQFLSFLSHKIRILSRQFTVFLSSPETRQRIPITGKVNLSAISHTGPPPLLRCTYAPQDCRCLTRVRSDLTETLTNHHLVPVLNLCYCLL
ncbi:hypothetical protein DVH24_003381 [Malus domestica]|uniref:DUF7138 domain-containing protein n=1 Tax=Malus domestica TaxID=3750 RepID=A0A498INT0_MALDO|nr:hypothetical protein DVH24_003381 [Malus domestica]